MLPIGHARAEGKPILLGAEFLRVVSIVGISSHRQPKSTNPISLMFLHIQRQLLFGKPKLSRCLFQYEWGAVLIEARNL